jgi:NTP pyrophosphatase (non-canonical NTP hydrolase)
MDQRIESMDRIKKAIKEARTEGSDLPISTIAVLIAESLESLDEVRAFKKSLEDYVR